MINEIRNELKTSGLNESKEDNEFDSEYFLKEDELINFRQLKNPLSISLNIEKEQDLEEKLSVFNDFLYKAKEDMNSLRNKYITLIGKAKFFEISQKFAINENENQKLIDQDSTKYMNKSLTNMKNFIVKYIVYIKKFFNYKKENKRLIMFQEVLQIKDIKYSLIKLL